MECRICHEETETDDNRLFRPCDCSGSLAFVHRQCLNRWIIKDDATVRETDCHLCKQPYSVDYIRHLEVIPKASAFAVVLFNPLLIVLLYQYFLLVMRHLYPPIGEYYEAIERDVIQWCYGAILISNIRLKNFWLYIDVWHRKYYIVPLVHYALKNLETMAPLKYCYFTELWMSTYWITHLWTLKEVNRRLLW